jgi:hypothetical protein
MSVKHSLVSVSDFERQEPGVFVDVHESRLPAPPSVGTGAGRQGHGHVISYGIDKI